MNKIAIIGAGQLGSRHLQALNLVKKPLDITVIDSSIDSLKTAQARFEASITENIHQINYYNDFKLDQHCDVAIVASTAKSRRKIIEALLSSTHVNHLVLEKLLFTEKEDYEVISNILDKKDTKTWVNCPMRMMPFYKKLHTQFNNSSVHYHVTGSQYGLITNAIHYLDHLAYITGDNHFKLDLNYLDSQIINSKRPGYYEITGTLIAKYGSGSMAILHCDKQGIAPIQIEIFNNEHRVISKEWEQKAWLTNQNTDWKWQETEANIPFQSTLTAELVGSLLESNNCNLPDFKTSVKTHLQLLDPLKDYLINCGHQSESDYPFT